MLLLLEDEKEEEEEGGGGVVDDWYTPPAVNAAPSPSSVSLLTQVAIGPGPRRSSIS
jgi:hypothetical protein